MEINLNMPRVVGIDIPDNKRIKYALTYIKGVGESRAEEIINLLNLDKGMRAHDLTEEQISEISSLVDKKYIVEGELRRRVQENIKRLKEIGSYRGLRHKKGLPVRGQKTQSNARTRKGPRRTVGGVSVRKTVSKT